MHWTTLSRQCVTQQTSERRKEVWKRRCQFLSLAKLVEKQNTIKYLWIHRQQKKKLPKMGSQNHMKSTLKHLVGAVVKWWFWKHNAHFVSANIPPAGCLCLDVQNDLLYICFFWVYLVGTRSKLGPWTLKSLFFFAPGTLRSPLGNIT